MTSNLDSVRCVTMVESEDYKILNVSEKAFKDFQAIMKKPEFKRIDDLQNKHPFLLAMVLGFKNNRCIAISGKHSGGYCREETLSDDERSIIKAIAINKTNDVNIIGNLKMQYQIAEMYANGGVEILNEIASQPGDFFVNLSKEL